MLNELPIVFHSQGVPWTGRFFRNTTSWQERQPAIITMGSWLTVKEQMATTDARRFAELGYTTFVFDFAGFGESRTSRCERAVRASHAIGARRRSGARERV